MRVQFNLCIQLREFCGAFSRLCEDERAVNMVSWSAGYHDIILGTCHYEDFVSVQFKMVLLFLLFSD
jgi:hypothetical protein